MRLSIVTQPSVEPLTTAEAKAQSRVDISADDTIIASYIVAARKLCESLTRRCFITTVLKYSLDEFPSSMNGVFDNTIRLPRSSVISVDSITYVDTNGTTQTLNSNTYIASLGDNSRIVPVFNGSFPAARKQPDSINITFTCGYGATSAYVPENVRQAMRFLVDHYYNNRSNVEVGTIATAVPFTVESLLASECWRGSL